MAAAGLVEDQIALRLGGMDKNRLRRRHIEALKQGRASAAAKKAREAARQPSRQEREQLERIKASFASEWYSKTRGNDLYGGAHTIEEALAWCAQLKPVRQLPNDEDGPDDPVKRRDEE
jgi:hypothetical protein